MGLDLEEGFEHDFNARLEDGSPYEVGSGSQTDAHILHVWLADGRVHMRS